MASVDRQDIMLLIADGADGPYPLDPIRLMKGCFIVDQIGPDDWKDLFATHAPSRGQRHAWIRDPGPRRRVERDLAHRRVLVRGKPAARAQWRFECAIHNRRIPRPLQ